MCSECVGFKRKCVGENEMRRICVGGDGRCRKCEGGDLADHPHFFFSYLTIVKTSPPIIFFPSVFIPYSFFFFVHE